MKYKIGDIVSAQSGCIKNAIVIDTFSINDVVTIEYYGRRSNVYCSGLILVKHQPFYALKKRIKYQLSVINNFIYRYNPLNYRINHKDDIEVL